jgi:hypothetical protein
MGCEDSTSTAGGSVNDLFVCRSILDWVVEGIMVAVYNKLNQVSFFIEYAYLRASENIPFWDLIVIDQAERTSNVSATSDSGFSAITQVQASIPADIAEGVKTSNGTVTK